MVLSPTRGFDVHGNHLELRDHQRRQVGHQNEMRLLARKILQAPMLTIVNAAVRLRVELIQRRLKKGLLEVMVGPKPIKAR